MNKIPSYAYMGGKVRMRNWLIDHFPFTGNRYIELFAGLGNVYYAAANSLFFSNWILNDKYTEEFFNGVKFADLSLLPERLTDEDEIFLPMQYENGTVQEKLIAKLLEHKITLGGKGFKKGGYRTHMQGRYVQERFAHKIIQTRSLLQKARLYFLHWEDFLKQITPKLHAEDFIYCDPPYYDTTATYPNINHGKFISILTRLKCRWAISGYDSFMYRNFDYKNKYIKTRNREIGGSVNGGGESVDEVLWTNY